MSVNDGGILPAASSDLRERVVNESQRNLSIAWMKQGLSTDKSYFVSTSTASSRELVRLPRKSDT